MVSYGYQGTFSEEVNEFELIYNEFALRTYDPQIGRWTTPDPYDEFASPYLGMGNDPANNVDPSGGSILSGIWSFFGGGGSSSAASALKQVACPGTTTLFKIVVTLQTSISYFLLGAGGAAHAINKNVSGDLDDMGNGGSFGNGGNSGIAGGSNDLVNAINNELNSSIQITSGDEDGNDDGWKGFNKEDLETYAKYLGNKNPTDKDLGNLMEDIFYDWFSKKVALKFNFRKNSKKISDDENSVPDMVGDDQHYPTVIVGKGIFRRETQVGPGTKIPAGNIFEVKASTKGVYLSSNDWQVERHISNQIERLKGHMLRGFVPSCSLVTTFDVTWSERISNFANYVGVDYFHYRAQFRIVNGKYEFNFGRHNQALGSKGFK